MSNQAPQKSDPASAHDLPWYRQFWPWFIIALPAAAVIASFITLWLAVSHPDQLVVSDDQYQQLKSELKAQLPVQETKHDEAGASEPSSK